MLRPQGLLRLQEGWAQSIRVLAESEGETTDGFARADRRWRVRDRQAPAAGKG
jgi:hypothetical protein